MSDNQRVDGFLAWLSAPQRDLPWGWSQVLMVLVVFAVSLLIIGTTIAVTLDENAAGIRTESVLIGWLVGLLIAGAFTLIRFRGDPEQFKALSLNSPRVNPLLLLLLGFGFGLLADLIAGLGSGNFGTAAALRGVPTDNPQYLINAGTFSIVVQPVVEGLIFFGVLLPTLRRAIGPWPGLLTASVAFAGVHAAVYAAGLVDNLLVWYGLVLPLILGFGLGVVRVWSNSTRGAIIAYIGAGATLFFVGLVT